MKTSEQKPTPTSVLDCMEQKRLDEARDAEVPWKKWAVLSESQWDTIREDYSKDGNARIQVLNACDSFRQAPKRLRLLARAGLSHTQRGAENWITRGEVSRSAFG